MKTLLIFAYNSNLGKTQNYKVLPPNATVEDYQIKGFEGSAETELRSISFNDLKFKNGMSPGAVFEVEKQEGTTYSWNKLTLPTARWRNQEDVNMWYALNKADAACKSNLTAIKKDELKEILLPIKEAYKNAHYTQKDMILSQVIRFITS